MPGLIRQAMLRVASAAERFGIVALAEASGVPEPTVRSYYARDWDAASLVICDALIAAADQLEKEAALAGAGR